LVRQQLRSSSQAVERGTDPLAQGFSLAELPLDGEFGCGRLLVADASAAARLAATILLRRRDAAEPVWVRLGSYVVVRKLGTPWVVRRWKIEYISSAE
jgi:hypothetical protein